MVPNRKIAAVVPPEVLVMVTVTVVVVVVVVMMGKRRGRGRGQGGHKGAGGSQEHPPVRIIQFTVQYVRMRQLSSINKK